MYGYGYGYACDMPCAVVKLPATGVRAPREWRAHRAPDLDLGTSNNGQLNHNCHYHSSCSLHLTSSGQPLGAIQDMQERHTLLFEMQFHNSLKLFSSDSRTVAKELSELFSMATVVGSSAALALCLFQPSTCQNAVAAIRA